MGVVRKNDPIESEWEKITYMVFDLPLVNLPFEERYKMMKTILKDVPHVKVVENTKISSVAQFNKIHKDLVSKGAEGTMIRTANSYYQNKRSKDLLKVKDFHDAEVVVIGHETGSGRNANILGALIVKWQKSGMGTNIFKVGSGFNDQQRNNYKTLFKIGTVITIQYFEIDKTSQKPRFPIFMRVRHAE